MVPSYWLYKIQTNKPTGKSNLYLYFLLLITCLCGGLQYSRISRNTFFTNNNKNKNISCFVIAWIIIKNDWKVSVPSFSSPPVYANTRLSLRLITNGGNCPKYRIKIKIGRVTGFLKYVNTTEGMNNIRLGPELFSIDLKLSFDNFNALYS